MNKGGIKLSDSDKRLIIILLSIVLVVVVYFLVFARGMNKASEIEAQNEEDQQTLQSLQDMVARAPQIQEQTEEMNAERDEIISHYPASVRTEDVIRNILDMEDETNIETSEVSFSTGNAMSTTIAAATSSTDDSEDGEGASTAQSKIYGYYTTASVRYAGGYEDLKSVLSYIADLNDRTTISSVSAAYDSTTGQLAGTMTINMYYMLGTDAEYEEPEFGTIDTGVENIFGATLENAEEGEGEEQEAEAE
ncbi:MAG: hypothetical protein LUI02_02425 [Clostridiales bacterium]|nr:hypothetical protein [Clostridiales bacterium]